MMQPEEIHAAICEAIAKNGVVDLTYEPSHHELTIWNAGYVAALQDAMILLYKSGGIKGMGQDDGYTILCRCPSVLRKAIEEVTTPKPL